LNYQNLEIDWLEDNEYTAMNNFKSRVLEPSIKQINEHTDITVTYEQHKKGRYFRLFIQI
jgi:plasmid replication initiation protein